MRKKTAAVIISFLSAAVLALGIVAGVNTAKLNKREYAVRAGTERAFSELVSSMSQLSDNLEKSIYISDPDLQCTLCTQIYGCAQRAEMAISALPYSSDQIEQAAGFLRKTGDYACVLARSVNGGGGYTQEQWDVLSALSEAAGVLAGNLRDLHGQLEAGTLVMDGLETGNNAVPLMSGSIDSIENEFPELPTLIYDGPFSEGIRKDRPVYLEGMSEVDEQQARMVAAQMLAIDVNAVKCVGSCEGDVPCWCCQAQVFGSDYRLRITKQGGVIYSVLSSHAVDKAGYDSSDALEIASGILKSMGFEDMTESYHIIQNGVLTVNFEYEQDGIICYPDLIKVGIALDTGMLQSYDATGYVSAHCKREWPEEMISEEEAGAELSPALKVEKCQKALIPREGGEEVLCYEFLCDTGNDRRCLVYVNAQNGAQERIYLLLEDEAGTLTV